MKFTLKLANEAAPLLDWQIDDNCWDLECEAEDLPPDVRRCIAVRLLADRYVCKGDVEAAGEVGASLIDDHAPNWLPVEGTELHHLVEAVRKDHEDVEIYLAALAKHTRAGDRT